jgi:hypothetical protein
MKLGFSGRILKYPQIGNLMKIRPVGAELFHEDKQTYMTKNGDNKLTRNVGK